MFFGAVFRVKNHDFTPFPTLGVGGVGAGHQFRNLLTLIVENWSKF
jgi:hypothetical protein